MLLLQFSDRGVFDADVDEFLREVRVRTRKRLGDDVLAVGGGQTLDFLEIADGGVALELDVPDGTDAVEGGEDDDFGDGDTFLDNGVADVAGEQDFAGDGLHTQTVNQTQTGLQTKRGAPSRGPLGLTSVRRA